MLRLAGGERASARRSHQRHVAALLEELDERRQQLCLRHAYGAQPAGLRDQKAELQAVRDDLAAAIDAAAGAAS
jgi:hypothetical protein